MQDWRNFTIKIDRVNSAILRGKILSLIILEFLRGILRLDLGFKIRLVWACGGACYLS